MQSSRAEKRSVLMLASAQALFQTISTIVMTISGVVGLHLAEEKGLSTLPIALMMVAAAATMIPASMLMQRIGRRRGFMLGSLFGCVGGMLGAWSIWLQDFWLFVAANALVGCYQGFAQYYRFAAADIASEAFRSRAIAWVIAGGIVAAIAGPNIARLTSDIGPVPFLPAYVALSVLSMAALAVVALTPIPPMVSSAIEGPARPLRVIMRQPVFLAALAGSSVGYAVMVMVMTATPLAMRQCGHSLGAAATVIQWHVLGMFLPSFFSGNLIRRYGTLPVMGAGVALLGTHVVIALSGIAFLEFVSGLIILGVGWNFLFIGGTTLLTEAYLPAERAKTQAAHDFIMFGAVSTASLSAGGILNAWGWQAVNYTVVPLLALAGLAIAGLSILRSASARHRLT